MRLLQAGGIRPRHAMAGALALGTTLSVTALALAETAPAPASSQDPRPPVVRDATLRLGQRADVSGRFAASEAGRHVTLQYAPRGHHRWRPIADAVVEPGGRYRFRVRLKHTGAVRIALRAGAGSRRAERRERRTRRRRAANGASPWPAGSSSVTATATCTPARRVHVRGTLLPRTRGRRVVVEAGANGRWQAVARARTRANGHFDARVVAEVPGTRRMRVRFAGDRRNAGRAHAPAAPGVPRRRSRRGTAGCTATLACGGDADGRHARRRATRRCRAGRRSRSATAAATCACRSSTAARTSAAASATSPRATAQRLGSAAGTIWTTQYAPSPHERLVPRRRGYPWDSVSAAELAAARDRPPRLRRVLRVGRAAAPARAARQAGGRRRHRAARGRDDRQLRGAQVRHRLGDAGLAGAARCARTRSSSRPTSRAYREESQRGVGARARAARARRAGRASTRPTST